MMTDEKITFKVGNVLHNKANNQDFRILSTGDRTTFIRLDVPKILIYSAATTELYQAIMNEGLEMVEDNDETVVDLSSMSDSQIEQFKKDKLVCELIKNHFYPVYDEMTHNKKDGFIHSCKDEYGYAYATLYRKLKNYFQSGFKEISLVDKRNLRYKNDDKHEVVNGKLQKKVMNSQRISEKDYANFEKYFKQYKSSKYLRQIDAYTDMVNECYRSVVKEEDGSITFGSLDENRPSLRQFRYYINSHLTEEQKDSIIMKKHEVRNNKRLLSGSASTGVSYPGECVEIDEVDMPVSLVSRYDANQTVGRANVYMMIDVLTHVILAVGIAFNQNSYIGLTNMFINMSDDKVAYCKYYNLPINEEDWPSNIIPARIRCDQGSDFKGSDIYRVCQQLGIERNLEPVATGSMKSLIENSFHLIQQQQRSIFEDYGLITKDWGSKHHKQAMLNIDQFTKTLLILIIEHNRHSMANFTLSPEMITLGVKPRPVDLWKYYSEHVQSPMPISDKQQYLISLMKTGTAYYDRKGVHFIKRTYSVNAEEFPDLTASMYANQNKRTSIEIKFDPRNMNNIYVIHNSKLVVFKMNMKKQENIGYENLTEQEIIELNSKRSQLDKAEKEHNEQLYADARLTSKAIISESFNPTLPNDKNMRNARKNEKAEVAQTSYSIAKRLGISETLDDSKELSLQTDSIKEIANNPEITDDTDSDNKTDDELFEELYAIGKDVNKL